MRASEALELCFSAKKSEIWKKFLDRLASSKQRVAYYPSAGDDFDAISVLLDSTMPDVYVKPDIFIFSDYSNMYISHADFEKCETTIRLCNRNLRIKNCCELEPNPAHYDYFFNAEYTAFGKQESTGKAFYFQADYELYPVDCIYFFYENVNLLSQFFVRHNVNISHLIWKRDGSGLGGGAIRHDFLVPICAKLKTVFFFVADYYYNWVMKKPVEDDMKRRYPRELKEFIDNAPDFIPTDILKTINWSYGRYEDTVLLLRRKQE
ncbi:MAG: hypothetical protein NZM06_00805 [Chloroherpetonaceae bacterium]|nr:hypothetical protein [Chloroherpetonaceae bacterium]